MAAAYIAFQLLCMALAVIAAHQAPAPAADCSSVVANMVDCLSFVTAGGTAEKPEGKCCDGLKTVVKTNPDCLCQAFKNSAQLGVTLNVSKALTLPAACHVSVPSLSTCALGPGIGAAPALSPIAISPSSVAGAPTAGMGGNGGAPAPSLGSSDSTVLSSSKDLLLFMALALVTSFALV